MADVQALQAEVRELRLALTEQQQAGSAVAAAADTFWLFLGTVLVFYMQCGFALLEAGAVRSKTTQNILLKVRDYGWAGSSSREAAREQTTSTGM